MTSEEFIKFIDSESFRNQLRLCIEAGNYKDYVMQGDNEVCIDVFDSNLSSHYIVELIKQTLTIPAQ